MDNQDEVQRVMHIKRELVVTTSTPGFAYIKQIGENALQAMTDKMLAEEDDVKGNNLRREVKAARIFMTTLFNAIEAAKQLVPDEDDGASAFGDFGIGFQTGEQQ